MLTAALTLGALGAAVLIGMALLERMLRDSVFTATAIIVLNLTTTFLGSWSPVPVIGSFTVVPRDALFVLVMGAGVLRMLRIRELTPVQRLTITLVGLITLSLIRGLPINGIEDTARESRSFLYFFGGALYFATVDPTQETIRRIGRLWIYAAVGFAAIVLFRWAALVGGAPLVGIFTRSREAGGIRVIDNQNTLVLAQAMFLLVPLFIRREATRVQRRILLLLAPVAVFLQHRTIWVVLLVAAVVVAIRNPDFGRKAVAGIVAGAAGIAVVTAALSTGGRDVLPQAPTDTGTIVWRFEGWAGLLTQQSGRQEDYLIGRPLGSGYERELATSGNVVDTSPHNFYVQVYLRMGLFGLVLFPLLFLTPLRRFWSRRGAVFDPVNEGLLTLLIMQLTFMIAWTPDFDQGIVTGLAGALAYRVATTPPTDRAPARA